MTDICNDPSSYAHVNLWSSCEVFQMPPVCLLAHTRSFVTEVPGVTVIGEINAAWQITAIVRRVRIKVTWVGILNNKY